MKNVPANLSKPTQVERTRNQDLIGRCSIHTILNIRVVCLFDINVECVRDCIFGTIIDLASCHVTVACFGGGGSHRTLMEGSELRDDRLWLCNIENFKNCNANVRMCNGNGAEGVTENAQNATENVRNAPRNVLLK